MQIFGIYMLPLGSEGKVEDVLKPGTEMVAAGYCMYGSSCAVRLKYSNPGSAGIRLTYRALVAGVAH